MVNGAPSVASDLATEPSYRQATVGPLSQVRAYLGVPLVDGDDDLFGTLCAFAGTPQPATWHAAGPLVSVMGRMLSTVLAGERAAHDRSVEAAHAYALAERDPLTGLRNRRGFEQAVHTEQGRGLRFGTRSSIIAVTVRPPARGAAAISDAALRRCAHELSAVCEPGDVAARTAGSQFALLAAETDLIGARALQARLRSALRSADLVAAIGVAARRPWEDLTDTRARAERAMRDDERRRTPRTRDRRIEAVP
jgi:GGDEF domain-containing protein